MNTKSYHYIQGKLLNKGTINMCTYSKEVKDCNNQSLQHFISNLPWGYQPVINHIQQDVTNVISDPNHDSLQFYKCCIPKQGKLSGGAAHQYCSQLGKTTNIQSK